MLIHKITPYVDYISGWNVWTLNLINQSIKIHQKFPKLLSQQIRKRNYQTVRYFLFFSWGSGANPWGPEKDDRFSKPNHWDGNLEVVGVTGTVTSNLKLKFQANSIHSTSF